MKMYDIAGRVRDDISREPALRDALTVHCWDAYRIGQDLAPADTVAVAALADILKEDASALRGDELEYCRRTADEDAERAYSDKETVRGFALATAIVHVVMRKYYHRALGDPSVCACMEERRSRASKLLLSLYGENMDWTTVPVSGNATMSTIHLRLQKEAPLPQAQQTQAPCQL